MRIFWFYFWPCLLFRLRISLLMLGCVFALPVLAQEQAALAAKGEFFEARIRPVLVERCYTCHSASAEKLKGDLHLDSLQGLLTGGETGPAIVPGKPEKSRLMAGLRYQNPDFQMPPKGKLSDNQINDFEKWIADGAVWPGAQAVAKSSTKEKFNIEQRKKAHWAWQPVTNPTVPEVKDKAWPVNGIDPFILRQLERAGINPAKQAGKRELLRRVTFDMIGLPPTEAEMDAFLKDESSEAYPMVVDRLLNSPHFGEKWARHWLDLVRYAETFGHEFDYTILNAWRYRDYVIRAFNENLPYDQFVREQVAGDLLAKPRFNAAGENESIQGTAFYWLGQQVHSPVDVRNYQLERIDNQIDVLTKTFQGMTVSCARCHDHKFDAISTKDYYSMFSVMASSRYAARSIVAPEVNAGVIKQLAGTKKEIEAEFHAALKNALPEANRYISAVREVKTGKPTPEETEVDQKDFVFDDFESGTYSKWTVTGTAFGKTPQSQKTVGSYQGNLQALGKYFVNSHNIRGGEDMATGDAFTGKMVSQNFAISRDYIHMLIGGGNHPGKTCVQLRVGGEVIRSHAGPNNNRMFPQTWRVAEFKGKEAVIEIIDEEKGGWGNIGLDHIVFSNRPRVFGSDNQILPGGRNLGVVAATKRVDATILQKWVDASESAPQEVKNFLFGNPSAEPMESTARKGDVVFAQGSDFKNWLMHGEAFAGEETFKAQLALRAGEPARLALVEEGIHSAGVSRKLEGALRSPSFKISKPFIQVRSAGNDARLNVVVDGFTLIRSPIYGGLKLGINHEEPAWQTVDVAMWQGHECYLEFADLTAPDTSDGKNSYSPEAWFSVHEVVFSEAKAVPQRPMIAGGELPNGVINWMAKNQLVGLQSDRLQSLIKQFSALETKITPAVYVPSIADGNGFDEKIFVRGNHRTLGEMAPRGFMEALHFSPGNFSKGSGRLQLAEELLRASNPLTARVRVNWLWKHLFGQGLVASVDNFGVLGEKPTHPELLDYLSTEFRSNGWNVKKMLRAMALSKTYQMSSEASDIAAHEKDPTNKLLSRAHVRRLEAELIRDSILAVSGSLKKELAGKPAPIHLTPFMEGRGRPGSSGPVDGEGRRTIYVEVRRNFLSPLVLAFDGPIPFTTVGRRSVSNVPAQALILMNDPFVIGEARKWAERLVAGQSSESAEARIEKMYSVALGRKPAQHELDAAKQFLLAQADLYQMQGGELMRSAEVWADFAHVMFNLKEFVFIN